MSDGESVNDMTADAATFKSTSYVHCVSKNDTDLASYHPSVYELIRLRQILAEMCSIFETQLYRRSPCCCDRFCPQSDDQHVCNSRINLSHWSLKKKKINFQFFSTISSRWYQDLLFMSLLSFAFRQLAPGIIIIIITDGDLQQSSVNGPLQQFKWLQFGWG